jgi:hypothetical protein
MTPKKHSRDFKDLEHMTVKQLARSIRADLRKKNRQEATRLAVVPKRKS